MTTLIIKPLPGAGRLVRASAFVRGFLSRRLIPRLSGVDVVVIQGRVYPVRAVPLGVARDLVPAIVRCSQSFASWQMSEALYDDLIRVLALGLGLPTRVVENFSCSLWDLAPVVERIAVANGLPVMEAGQADLGKLMEVLTGTSSTAGSSPQPAGPGNTSTNA